MLAFCCDYYYDDYREQKRGESMNAIGYIRVSTADQADSGLSLQYQESKIRAYAEAMDITLVDVVADAGFSAKSMNRPAIQGIISQIKNKTVDAVIILKLDRLTRSVKDLGAIVELIEKNNVALVSVQDSINTSTAAGRLILNVLGSVSQWEREANGERVKAALSVKKGAGERVGTIPYGFDLAADGVALVENADEQNTLKIIRKLRSEGLSLRKIGAELDKRGISTKKGGKWQATTIKQLCEVTA
ncbi:MAG: recombinase family protein [Erysipelotrichia bacterium]|nr:recombinase family protein [Erysipelotrichia bacterium]